MAKVEEYQQMMAWLTRPKSKFQEPRSMDQAALVDELEPGSLKDEMLGKFNPDQETYEEYLRRINLERPFNMNQGGRIGFYEGKLVIDPPKMTPEKQKKSATTLQEDFLGQLKDKRRVRTSNLDDAFEVFNVIKKNKGHVGTLAELGRLAGFVFGPNAKNPGKVNHAQTKLAFDLALDSFKELEGFQLADVKYPKIDKKKFKYLDMISKSFANYNMTDDAVEAAAHLLEDNMAKIVDLGDKIYLEDPKDPTKPKKVLEGGFFGVKHKIKPADKKFISERVSALTGKDFNIDNVNELIEETKKVRNAKGSLKTQLKRLEKMNEQILNLAGNDEIKNLLKGELDGPTQKLLLEKSTKLVGGDASIASRRLFQMAEAMSDTTNKYKDLGIKINNNMANKIIATGREIGGRNNRYGMSSALYNYYGNVVDKALRATEGNSFIGKYQQEIRNLLDKGQSPDEIFSLTASARRDMAPYAIFTQNLRTDVNSAIKGAYIDAELSKTHSKLQNIFQGKTYDKLNTAEKKAVQKLVSDFETKKIDALNKPINPGEVKKGAKPIYLSAAEKKNIQLPEFDLKNPPSKSIAGFNKRFKKYPNIKKAFEESYKKVGYGMKVKPGMLTQKEFINKFNDTFQNLSPRSAAQLAKTHGCKTFSEGGSIIGCLKKKFNANPEKFLQKSAPLAKDNVNLFKWFKNGRKIARGTGVALAWEAAFAPIIAGWGALEGQSGERILNDIAYGIPFIGETEKEEWMKYAGGNELAYKMKQMGELEEQELPYLDQQLEKARKQSAPTREKMPKYVSPKEQYILDDIKEKELKLQGLYNTPEFWEGPAGSYYNEPAIQKAYDLEQKTTAQIAADTAKRKKDTFDKLREMKIIADKNWQSQSSYAGGGIASIRRPHAIPPESGPTPQGLPSMYNRVKRI